MLNMGAGPQKFQQYFRCYPVIMMSGKERDNLNYGGKIVMPPSALNRLTMLHVSYPMIFALKNEETQLTTHAGVLEFIAEEGRVYLPNWMMDTLALSPGSLIQIESILDLPRGTFVKIQPQSTDFLDIYDPKAVLENALRNFTTLSVDDLFQISYNDHIYTIKVLEVQPQTSHNSVCVVETDLEVDFAPPVGYDESLERAKASSNASTSASGAGTPLSSGGASAAEIAAAATAARGAAGSMARSIDYMGVVKRSAEQRRQQAQPQFGGSGQKLSGRALNSTTSTKPPADDGVQIVLPEDLNVEAPPLDLPFGQLFFGYPVVAVRHTDEEKRRESLDEAGRSVHFQGTGMSLRESRKRKAKPTDESF